MMAGPSAHQLLAIWEAGAAADPTGRALLLTDIAGGSPGGVEPADLPIGARDRLLIDLRERLFGSGVEALTACPACGERLEFEFDLADIRAGAGEPAGAPMTVEIDGYSIKGRLPTSRDLAAVASSPSVAVARAALLERCLLGAHQGSELVERGELPEGVLEAFGTALGAADPQADVELALSCLVCEERWTEHFDIVDFLWSETERWATGLLREVHLLALAYGWSEAAILAMSGARRQRYLEMMFDG